MPSTRRDSGSVLLLFPAAVTIMLVMAGLVIDVAHVRLVGDQLEAAAASAADDALGALDVEALRAGAGIVIDPTEAERIVRETVAAGPHPEAVVADLDLMVGTGGDTREIAVTLRLAVDLVIAPALGDLSRVTITRTGRAVILAGSG